MVTPLLDMPLADKAGDRKIWGALEAAAGSLAIAQASRAHKGLLVVITQDGTQAELMRAEIDFFLAADDIPILTFPDWETLPYDHFSPHQDIISERLQTLYQLPNCTSGVLVVSVTTLMHRLLPMEYLQQNSLLLKKGQTLNLQEKRRTLESCGYRCVDNVYEHGEFAVRGAILDIFPMGSKQPFRIDLFDDVIDNMRIFDAETQRSLGQVDDIRLLPAKEFPLTEQGITHFTQEFRARFPEQYSHCTLYKDIKAGLAPAGIEYYLPLFFPKMQSLFDYLPNNTLIFTQGHLSPAIERFQEEVNARYQNLCVDPQRPLLKPEAIFLPEETVFSHLKPFARVQWGSETQSLRAGRYNFPTKSLPQLTVNPQDEQPFTDLQNFAKNTNCRILFCTETVGRCDALRERLKYAGIDPLYCDNWQAFTQSDNLYSITVGALDRGLFFSEPALVLLTENELFGRITQQRRNKTTRIDPDQIFHNLTELNLGDPVVHIDHGVGRYYGLTTLDSDQHTTEFLTLEYANEAKLYVPVAHLHLISRYTGNHGAAVPLHHLGNEQWGKAKRKAAEKAEDVAAELLEIYARRAAKSGFAYAKPDADYRTFSDQFAFEETPDQQSAIAAVIEDMTHAKPMDRLICGDVGFGKTEVAMRATFLAVQEGKQVAILVPTTLLAQQHYETLCNRFSSWPVNIDVFSRFKSTKQSNELAHKLAQGEIDIVVGTHKLLQKQIQFKQLGLMIIDEEHRFGVKQKEQLKALRAEVDILTMTATPIPRTLNMAMAQIRDLSIIATPPEKRLSVRTFVQEHSDSLVKEALLRELLRGGQVYYLHNDVKTIERAAEHLQALVPEARIGIGHGQLRERELEKVMTDFYHRRFNVLVCSTIIETGIDVPSANTIIIHRADRFGLAQLHQLRGRVGRSHHQAYAYLLSPPKEALTTDAAKRLEAIVQSQALGAGFTLATHDLEIRGAGELLGDDQSGQMQSVGFTLYTQMLEQAVDSLKKGDLPNLEQTLHQGPEINLHIAALIPDKYLPDVHSRLILYKRIASAQTEEQLLELKIEMIDRFGALPETTQNLLRITRIKQLCLALGIHKINMGPAGGRLEFGANTAIDPARMVQLLQSDPQHFQLEGARLLRYKKAMPTADIRFEMIHGLLKQLSES